MDSFTLGNAFIQAKNNLGWFGGYANLDFETDKTGAFQGQVLS